MEEKRRVQFEEDQKKRAVVLAELREQVEMEMAKAAEMEAVFTNMRS